MRLNAHFCCRAFIYLIAASCIAAFGEVNGQTTSISGGISATGQQEITLQPNRVRLVLQIQAEGRDAKTAIKNLADHKSKINAALKEMNADMASVVFEGNKLIESIAGMPAENPGSPRLITPATVDPFGDPDAEAADSPAKIVTAKSTVTAEWALPTEDIDALSLLPESLKQQVQQRDLQGKKIKAELSDEEKEIAADYVRRVSQQRGSYYSNTPAPQDVQILYVAITTRDQEKEALKAAYQEAVASAQLLAEATGQKLGKIRSISRSDLTNDMTSTSYEYDAYGNAVRRTVQKRNPQEITSPTPTQMSKKVGLTVVFGID